MCTSGGRSLPSTPQRQEAEARSFPFNASPIFSNERVSSFSSHFRCGAAPQSRSGVLPLTCNSRAHVRHQPTPHPYRWPRRRLEGDRSEDVTSERTVHAPEVRGPLAQRRRRPVGITAAAVILIILWSGSFLVSAVWQL